MTLEEFLVLLDDEDREILSDLKSRGRFETIVVRAIRGNTPKPYRIVAMCDDWSAGLAIVANYTRVYEGQTKPVLFSLQDLDLEATP